MISEDRRLWKSMCERWIGTFIDWSEVQVTSTTRSKKSWNDIPDLVCFFSEQYITFLHDTYDAMTAEEEDLVKRQRLKVNQFHHFRKCCHRGKLKNT